MPGNRYYQGPITDHFDGQRFHNPGHPSTDKSLADMLRWKLARAAAPWPSHVPITPAKPDTRVDSLRVTMIGHASLLIQAAGFNILVDPVWSDRASPFAHLGPKRVTQPGIVWNDLPPIDVVLLTHSHYDHMDRATLARLAPQRPRVIAPLGNDAILARAVPALTVETADWYQSIRLAPRLEVTIVPAYHWSARNLRDRRMALWCGFVIWSGAHTTYIAGDTALGDGNPFRDVLANHFACDLAILPIGAYEPRWFMRNQHANPEDAVHMFQLCGAKRALGVHWGTFQLTDEPRDAPPAALAAACAAAGLPPGDFTAFAPGETWQP